MYIAHLPPCRILTDEHLDGGSEPPSPIPLQAYVGINWILTDEHLDVETELALGFLDYLMLGTNAAPLRKVWGSGGSEGVD